jgi:hypothetical protein
MSDELGHCTSTLNQRNNSNNDGIKWRVSGFSGIDSDLQCLSHIQPTTSKLNWLDFLYIWSAVMKFPEWLYCKRTCILRTYWEESPSAAMHLYQWCCHCWKYFWNSWCGIAFSGVVTFPFLDVFNIPKSSDFTYVNSQKSFGANQGNRVGVPFQ